MIKSRAESFTDYMEEVFLNEKQLLKELAQQGKIIKTELEDRLKELAEDYLRMYQK